MAEITLTPDLYRRWLAKVDKAGDCWLWTGSLDRGGYGRFAPKRGTHWRAHRWSYEYHVGPIPEGLQIDHLCRVRNCVNPEHLEPVTPRENTLRGVSIQARNAAKTECVHGHPFTPENTFLVATAQGGVQRQCRECFRRRCREWYQQRKAEGWVRPKGKHSNLKPG